MANWSNNFPSWGDAGEQPPSGKDWQGGEQVNEKHLDYLFDQLNKTFDQILEHTLQDDGSVAADSVPFENPSGGNPELGSDDGALTIIDNDDAATYTIIGDGNGIERRIWVIDSGASDPADATSSDLIFEKEA